MPRLRKRTAAVACNDEEVTPLPKYVKKSQIEQVVPNQPVRKPKKGSSNITMPKGNNSQMLPVRSTKISHNVDLDSVENGNISREVQISTDKVKAWMNSQDKLQESNNEEPPDPLSLVLEYDINEKLGMETLKSSSAQKKTLVHNNRATKLNSVLKRRCVSKGVSEQNGGNSVAGSNKKVLEVIEVMAGTPLDVESDDGFETVEDICDTDIGKSGKEASKSTLIQKSKVPVHKNSKMREKSTTKPKRTSVRKAKAHEKSENTESVDFRNVQNAIEKIEVTHSDSDIQIVEEIYHSDNRKAVKKALHHAPVQSNPKIKEVKNMKPGSFSKVFPLAEGKVVESSRSGKRKYVTDLIHCEDDSDDDFQAVEEKIFEGINYEEEIEMNAENATKVESGKKTAITRKIPEMSTRNELSMTKQTKKSMLKNKRSTKDTKNDKESKKAETSSKSPKFETTAANIANMDIASLLHLGEGLSLNQDIKDDFDSGSNMSSNSESDWEEVQSQPISDIPKEGIKITFQAPVIDKKRKHELEMEIYMKRRVNRRKREIQERIHKVHLLCFVAHGLYVNTMLNSEVLFGIALSFIPSKHCYPPKHMDMDYLEKLVKWFREKFKFKSSNSEENTTQSVIEVLQQRFAQSTALTLREYVFMFVVIVRSLGIEARMVMSIQPEPLKIKRELLIQVPSQKLLSSEPPEPDLLFCTPVSNGSKMETLEPAASTSNIQKESKSSSKTPNPKSKSPITRCKKSTSKKSVAKSKGNSSDSESDIGNEKRLTRAKQTPKKSILKSTPELDSDTDSDFDPESTQEYKINKHKKIISSHGDEDSDSETDTKKKKVSPTTKSKKKASPGSGKKVNGCSTKKGEDYWAEVYLEQEEKWMCVCLSIGEIYCMAKLETKATQPISYILGFHNNLSVKELTCRYASRWHSDTRRLRTKQLWWDKSLKPFTTLKTAKEKLEDEQLKDELQQRPLPLTIKEYKDHPLFVLKRHLLKFQALYPPDVLPLGFIKKEAVFPRKCVKILRSRERWMKVAKKVRDGEEPYKIVRGQPRWDKVNRKIVTDDEMGIFGTWQVEEYVPPVAVDGKVPRNGYGNVEVFKPSMVPGGCVHLKLPGLSRVARKLGIDCAPAFVGFNWKEERLSAFDGYIVCEEFQDVLILAWDEEQEIQKRKDDEKRDKRVYGNWKRLIKGLFIRERLQAKYANFNIEEEEKEVPITNSKSQKGKKKKSINSGAGPSSKK